MLGKHSMFSFSRDASEHKYTEHLNMFVVPGPYWILLIIL